MKKIISCEIIKRIVSEVLTAISDGSAVWLVVGDINKYATVVGNTKLTRTMKYFTSIFLNPDIISLKLNSHGAILYL